MRIVMAILIGLLLMLQFELWRQYAQIAELQRQVDQQLDRNTALRERNNALAAEVADLKSGLAAVEERARAELGLVRDGEQFYLVVDPEDLPEGQTDALRELEALPDGNADGGLEGPGGPAAEPTVERDPPSSGAVPPDGG